MAADPRYAAYSFVDRIDRFEAGKRAHATFAIPARIDAFPPCLVAEAVGQLAAWVAMDRIDFRGRPVAALATETRFRGEAHAGEQLDLEVELQECDDDAVAYDGRASVGTRAVIELADCLGPMLPVAEFDSPEALRERLTLLRDGGAPEGRFRGIAPLPVAITADVPGKRRCATLDVPSEAPFFGDHFPRRAVFPATLLLDTELRMALDCAAGSPLLAGAPPRPIKVTHVKMRSFIEPGQRIGLDVELAELGPALLRAMLSARTEGRLVATARVEIGAAR
ncbi:MAG: hypothetical protein JSS46_09710 [Proteobacteria bacterium]|jgi:3-hydroxymyristoyl/3-hydroxydecanoyl-(acyl carrier protein) dehydratase|nr:hypothetical protein [Pseudomonadota bacterium]